MPDVIATAAVICWGVGGGVAVAVGRGGVVGNGTRVEVGVADTPRDEISIVGVRPDPLPPSSLPESKYTIKPSTTRKTGGSTNISLGESLLIKSHLPGAKTTARILALAVSRPLDLRAIVGGHAD